MRGSLSDQLARHNKTEPAGRESADERDGNVHRRRARRAALRAS